jgi:predicted ArsR family transcriptional regulator
MEKWVTRLEKEYEDLYNQLFDELSKLQIEEKFLERQAQSLIEDIQTRSSKEIQIKLEELLEGNDPDFMLQTTHIDHLKSIGQVPCPLKIEEILSEHFGSTDAEMYVFK